MLFSELYKIIVNKVTFLGFRGAIAPPGSAPVMKYYQNKDYGINQSHTD